MKHLVCIILIYFSFFSINAQNECDTNAIKQSVEHYINEYPMSTLKDLYKYFFHDEFGPRHLLNDTAAAKNYLMNELNSYTESQGRLFEPVGLGHNFYRVNLSLIKENIIDFETFFAAFIQSSKDTKLVNIDIWKNKWQQIVQIISSMPLKLPDFEKDSIEILNQLNNGNYIGNHSEIYNATYQPHYRLISINVFNVVILPKLNNEIKK